MRPPCLLVLLLTEAVLESIKRALQGLAELNAAAIQEGKHALGHARETNLERCVLRHPAQCMTWNALRIKTSIWPATKASVSTPEIKGLTENACLMLLHCA